MFPEIVLGFVIKDFNPKEFHVPLETSVRTNTPFLLPITMAEFSTKPSRFQMSFKKKERKFYVETENQLMEELHIPTKSDLYKYSLKFLKASRAKSDLAMV